MLMLGLRKLHMLCLTWVEHVQMSRVIDKEKSSEHINMCVACCKSRMLAGCGCRGRSRRNGTPQNLCASFCMYGRRQVMLSTCLANAPCRFNEQLANRPRCFHTNTFTGLVQRHA